MRLSFFLFIFIILFGLTFTSALAKPPWRVYQMEVECPFNGFCDVIVPDYRDESSVYLDTNNLTQWNRYDAVLSPGERHLIIEHTKDAVPALLYITYDDIRIQYQVRLIPTMNSNRPVVITKSFNENPPSFVIGPDIHWRYKILVESYADPSILNNKFFSCDKKTMLLKIRAFDDNRNLFVIFPDQWIGDYDVHVIESDKIISGGHDIRSDDKRLVVMDRVFEHLIITINDDCRWQVDIIRDQNSTKRTQN